MAAALRAARADLEVGPVLSVGAPAPGCHPFRQGSISRRRPPGRLGSSPPRPSRAAVPTWRSAFPCVCAILSRWGACRDVRHPGSGRTAVSLRFAQRCRPGGRRSLACAPFFPGGVRAETGVIPEVGEPRFRCALRRGAGPHRENWPEVGVPLRVRHSFPVGYVPRRASYGTWATRGFAALCAAVPTGGRRSLASGSSFPGGVRAETGVIREVGDTRFRCASRRGADRRSALPCQWAILSRWGTCRDGRHPGSGLYAVSLRFAPRCRPEVGVPLRVRHSFPVGCVPRRASYGTWATRGFAALCAAVPAPTGRTDRRSAFPCQWVILSRWGACRDGRHTGPGRHAVSLRFAQRCRPEVGVPLPVGHPFPVGCVPRRASYGKWATRGFAALRAAVPTGGRRSLACAPFFPGGVRAETGVIRKWATRGFAALCAAVPTGGRRSLACAPFFPVGVRAETGVIREVGYTRFRCASRRGADRRSALPCVCAILSRWGTCRDGRHTGSGLYAVSLRFAQRCRPPPGELARGRRSLACASFFPVGVRAETGVIRDLGDTRFRCASRSGADRRSALPCVCAILSRWGTCRDGRHPGSGLYAVSLRFAPRCRPPPGELARGRRSLACSCHLHTGCGVRAATTMRFLPGEARHHRGIRGRDRGYRDALAARRGRTAANSSSVEGQGGPRWRGPEVRDRKDSRRRAAGPGGSGSAFRR